MTNSWKTQSFLISAVMAVLVVFLVGSDNDLIAAAEAEAVWSEGVVVTERIDKSFDPATSEPSMTTIVDAAYRLDGSRSETRLRYFPSEAAPAGYRVSEGIALYDAKNEVSYSIFPALSAYTVVPEHESRFVRRTQQADCRAFLPSEARSTAVLEDSGERFGFVFETYRFTIDMRNVPVRAKHTLQFFPQLGCLEGDRLSTSFVLDGDQNEVRLRSKQMVSLISLAIQRDDPNRFAPPDDSLESVVPSELVVRMNAANDEECSSCVLESNARFDERYKKLWETRQAKAAEGKAASP